MENQLSAVSDQLSAKPFHLKTQLSAISRQLSVKNPKTTKQ
jgi:hypothetical protein